ncbi:uncharacterized protein HMPREF1541_04782 [Cyphellophora europaea CBS 101466]|uniref:Uncharacterized protein n=1 Tax=Cyphellophora europaea (strain CBS 101466) TaxID=1220924 RepID=W2RW10_CYPE1|nr:uncharacterized protein HMPREF1541_04782 [Cyphellophora europaea CBS 101466]ETN40505.1 hypothetical protein HMPREF1541_04782 [Cyphellophora europaea CBS 101466]
MRDFNPYGIGYRINEDGLVQPTGRGLLREEFIPHLVTYDWKTIPVDIRDFYCGYNGLPWVNIRIRGTGKSEDRDEEDSNGDMGSTPSKPPGTSRRVSGKTARKASGKGPAAADKVAPTSLEQVHGVDSSPVLQTPEPDSGPNAESAPVSRSEGQATPSRLDGSVPNTPESPVDATAELPSSTQDSFYSLPGEYLTEQDLATITDLAASGPAAVQLQQAVVASSVVLTAASAAAAALEQQRLPAYKSETAIRTKPDPVMETLA